MSEQTETLFTITPPTFLPFDAQLRVNLTANRLSKGFQNSAANPNETLKANGVLTQVDLDMREVSILWILVSTKSVAEILTRQGRLASKNSDTRKFITLLAEDLGYGVDTRAIAPSDPSKT